MENKTLVSIKEKMGFLSFSTSSNIVFNFKSLYYLIFLTNVLGVPVRTAAMILALGTVWDAVNDPLIGIFAANHTFRNGEKIRPFALWCAVPWAVTIVLMFSNFNVGRGLTIALCLIIYFVFEALNTFIDMPYNSMGALASNVDADRKSINAFRSLGGCLGSGIGSVAVTPLVKLFGGLKGEGAIIGKGDARALFITACVMGLICIFGCLSHYFTSKERVKQSSEDDSRISLIQAYRMLFKCRSWVLNMLYIICYGIITALVMNNINYYAAYILGSSDAATPILAVYLVVAILLSILTPAIDAKIGRKNTMLLGAAVLILGKIPFLSTPYSALGIYTNAFSVGFGATVTFVMFNTNRNNIADIVEWKNGRRIDSMVAAGDNLASKLAEALAVEVMGFALSAAGLDAVKEFTKLSEMVNLPEYTSTIRMLCALLGWVPFAIAVLMLLVLYKMDIEKEMKESRPAQAEI